jgi:sugar lactone lactonase YvrE
LHEVVIRTNRYDKGSRKVNPEGIAVDATAVYWTSATDGTVRRLTLQ